VTINKNRKERTKSIALTFTFGAWICAMGCNPVHIRVAPQSALQELSQPSFSTPVSDQTQDDSNQSRPWTFFEDEALEGSIKQVLQGNLSIIQAASRLKGAVAARDSADASYFPSLDLSASRSQSESFMFGRNITQDQVSVSVAASYELDLFDKLGGARRAAALEQAATRQDLEAIRITVSATYADVWFQHTEALKSIELFRAQKQTSEHFFSITQTRFRHGLVTAADVLQQRQQLETLKTMEAPLSARIQLTGHQLRVLEGSVPETSPTDLKRSLPEPMPISKANISAARLMRRPDLTAARLRIQSIDERVGAALANRLPSFRLSGNIGLGAASFSALFDQWLYSLSASIIAPIFDGGRRAAEVAQQRAILDQAMHQYRALYLAAIREVKDALVLAHQEDVRRMRLDVELQTSRRLLEEVKRRYISGVGPYSAVLNALQSLQRKERELLTTRRNQLTHRISLWRALGGVYTQASTNERLSDSDA
jgi:outer membrane protein, multidrug efflux system